MNKQREYMTLQESMDLIYLFFKIKQRLIHANDIERKIYHEQTTICSKIISKLMPKYYMNYNNTNFINKIKCCDNIINKLQLGSFELNNLNKIQCIDNESTTNFINKYFSSSLKKYVNLNEL